MHRIEYLKKIGRDKIIIKMIKIKTCALRNFSSKIISTYQIQETMTNSNYKLKINIPSIKISKTLFY